jgi:dTDP-4-dehydrorhamnose reductase
LKVIITGAGGLVGRAAVDAFSAKGESVVGLTRQELDISDELAVRQQIDAAAPDVVVNCAAWTDVDGCESDPEHALRANGLGPELLALACRRAGALLITISTDYVFDGAKPQGFYTQRDQPNPQSVYAHSKLEGERRPQASWARTIVVRSGYIFGDGGRNFLSKFLDYARAGKTLKAIDDCFGTPTYAPHLAERLHQLARIDLPGTYHVVNSGEGASFKEFIETGMKMAELDLPLVEAISMDSLARPAARPRNSRLRCLLSEAIGLKEMPHWREALREFVATTPSGASSRRAQR